MMSYYQHKKSSPVHLELNLNWRTLIEKINHPKIFLLIQVDNHCYSMKTMNDIHSIQPKLFFSSKSNYTKGAKVQKHSHNHSLLMFVFVGMEYIHNHRVS